MGKTPRHCATERDRPGGRRTFRLMLEKFPRIDLLLDLGKAQTQNSGSANDRGGPDAA
jgi:hypothetical protein